MSFTYIAIASCCNKITPICVLVGNDLDNCIEYLNKQYQLDLIINSESCDFSNDENFVDILTECEYEFGYQFKLNKPTILIPNKCCKSNYLHIYKLNSNNEVLDLFNIINNITIY